jgi:chromosome segregation ATPase
MAFIARSLVVLAACCVSAGAVEARLKTRATHRMNPIRRVVNMLQDMAKKVDEEGKAEKALFDEFMCYCSSGEGDLKLPITSAETKIPQLESSLKELEAEYAQLGSDLKTYKADRADAEAALAKATALRNKEAAIFAKASSDYKTNLAALTKAIAAVEAGSASSFLQTEAAARLQQITVDAEMSSEDRDEVSAFLTQSTESEYAPSSGEIVGILKQLKATMEGDLTEITTAEEKSIKDYDSLVAAKEKEKGSNSAGIEAKLAREGEVGEQIVMVKEDLEDTTKALAEDKKFLANLGATCEKKEKEFEEVSKVRAEESLAIADTIKLLNDDDALDLFKKTLPSPSLLQTLVSAKEMQRTALRALHSGKHRSRGLELIALTLRGGAKDFGKVLTMIDEMVGLLADEQKADDEKKTYCLEKLDTAEDEKKVLVQTGSDLEKAMAEAKEGIATLAEELDALADGIKKLDSEVAKATEMRQAEHKEFVSTMAADNAAKELIGMAKNRMQKFYNPKLYKAPPKRELSAEQRISVNMGGTLAPTNAPGGIAGTGITALAQAPVLVQVTAHDKLAAHAKSVGWGAYKKLGEESTGVLAMMDMMVADLDKEIQTMTVDEDDAQAEYEQLMADSAEKRAADVSTITDKEGAKAEMETSLQTLTSEHKDNMDETMAKEEEIKDLHLECDWLLQNFETRKEARAGEVDSLTKAKAVLSGADYALLQTRTRRTTLRR